MTLRFLLRKVLADAEDITLKYEKCDCQKKTDDKIDCTARHIVISDEIKNNAIVKQAIDRAITVADYLEKDRFELITVGRETNLTLNGNKLRTARDSSGKQYYFYGTAEIGYSYFTYNENTGKYEVYHGFGDRFGGRLTDENGNVIVVKDENGNDTTIELFKLKEAVNGVTVYYTATVEDGFTYYYKDEYRSADGKEIYVKVDKFTTYKGEVFQVVDGVEIKYDAVANVYYSENADGTYDRYEYSESIKAYYDKACAASDKTMDNIFNIIDGCKVDGSETSLDADFKEAVEKRMPKDDDTNDDEEEKEEETVSRYHTENIVVVTYGYTMDDPYKSIILNYNNYTVNVVYDGYEYTIAAYEFVVIEHKTTQN